MIIKLNGEICKDKNQVLNLIEMGNVNGGFTLSITLDNGDEYKIDYYDGTEHWYKNGKYHREDGPAVLYASGAKSWYIDGVCTAINLVPIQHIELTLDADTVIKSKNRKLKAVWSYEAQQDLAAFNNISPELTKQIIEETTRDYFYGIDLAQ